MIGQLRRVTAPLDIYVKTPTGIEIVVIYPDAVLLVTHKLFDEKEKHDGLKFYAFLTSSGPAFTFGVWLRSMTSEYV